jgi:hypothetical protein
MAIYSIPILNMIVLAQLAWFRKSVQPVEFHGDLDFTKCHWVASICTPLVVMGLHHTPSSSTYFLGQPLGHGHRGVFKWRQRSEAAVMARLGFILVVLETSDLIVQ